MIQRYCLKFRTLTEIRFAVKKFQVKTLNVNFILIMFIYGTALKTLIFTARPLRLQMKIMMEIKFLQDSAAAHFHLIQIKAFS